MMIHLEIWMDDKEVKQKPEFLYLEVNAWIVNGTVYTDFTRADAAAKHHNGITLQLYKKIINPDK